MMTEKELAHAIAAKLAISHRIAEQVVGLMRHAAKTAKVNVDLSTSGKVYTLEFVPGLP